MFGQPSSSTPFSTSSTPFGGGASSAPFGSPAPAPFGGGNGFGGGGGGGFGAPAPAPYGGGFGSAAPAPGGFGATSTSNSSPFGAPAPAPTGGIFGAPAPAQSGGLFGAPSPAPTGGFGTATNTGFGGGGAFGSPAPTAAFGGGGFGSPAPAPTGSIFGAPTPAPTFGGGFGAPAPAPAPTVGMFGTTAPATGMSGGLFGAPAAGGNGSKAAPFTVTSSSDGNNATSSQISFQSITAMPQYEGKSFEEIRFEDYKMGNKGDSTGNNTGAAASFGNFGAPSSVSAPSPAFGGFGKPPAPATFGAPAPAAFGTAAPAAFGSPAPAPFGAPPASGGFGSPAPPFGGFAPKPATGGIFGTPTPSSGGVFGSATAPSPGLFGANPVPAPVFGARTAAPTPGLFGAPAPAPPSGGMFGSQPTFGSPQGGIFGAPAPAPGGIFGNTAAPSPGLFGANPATAPGFGPPATAPPTGLFGAPAPAPPGGLFGSQPPFGSTAAPAAQPLAFASPMGNPANIIPPAADAALQQQLAAVENQKRELEKLEVWRGKSPSSSAIVPASLSESGTVLKLSPYCDPKISTYRASPMSTTKIRPRGFGDSSLSASPLKITASFGQGGNSLQNTVAIAASSAKRLVINAEAHTPKPSLRLRLTNGNKSSSKNENGSSALVLNGDSHVAGNAENFTERMSSPQTPDAVKTPTLPNGMKTGAPNGSGTRRTPDTAQEFYTQLVGSPKVTKGKDKSTAPTTIMNWRPKLTKIGYVTTPSILEMHRMSEADLAALSGFTISRDEVGSVEWEGTVDVRGADLDSIVSIELQDVAVYEEYEITGKKPPTGEKLNRPAVITLHDTFPPKGRANASAEVKDKFEKKLVKATLSMNASFISYDKTEGVWMFRVPHFSRYGFYDEESDDELEDSQSLKKTNTYSKTNLKLGEDKERLQMLKANVSPTRFTVPIDDDDDNDVEMVTRDRPSDELVIVNAAQVDEMDSEPLESLAKESYKAMFLSPQVNVSQPALVEDERDEACVFAEEEWKDEHSPALPIVSPPVPEQMHIGGADSICSRIRERSGISNSSVDMGIRMGRSFRVGWKPDGSFLHLSLGSILTQSRPRFSESSAEKSVQLLDVHMKNAEKNDMEFSLSEPKSMGEALHEMSDVVKTNDNELDSNFALNKAFTLIMCLLNTRRGEKSNNVTKLTIRGNDLLRSSELPSSISVRTTEAFRRWLKEVCISTSSEDIDSLKRRGKVYDAIFACLAAGDVMQASLIASEFGHLQLAGLIACGASSGHLVREQLRQWRETGANSIIPQDLLRIYSILGGDFRIEEQRYKDGDLSCDWIKRIALLLSYGRKENGGSYDFSSLIKKYEDDVASGIAPKPKPFHERNSTIDSRSKSSIYYLIHLCNVIVQGKEAKLHLSEVIQPLGHTPSSHNFSGAFQLASILSGLKCCIPLSEIEQAQLLSGYTAQLISAGKWEYAVYILLCSVGKTSLREWRQHQAKQLVLQHFGPENENLRRMLIEKIGVPSIWIQEGLADRFAKSGNTFSYVQQVRNFSMDLAREALEVTLLPTSFFRSPKEMSECLEFLRPFSVTADTLSATIVQLYDLSQEIEELSDQPTVDHETIVKSLKSRANSIEGNLLRYKSTLENLPRPTTNGTGEVIVPMSCFLAESLSGISYLKLQICVLESGGSIWDSSIRGEREAKKLALQLVSDTKMGSESVL